MARYELTGPDGARYQIDAPDEATQDEVLEHFKQHFNQGQPSQAQLTPEEKAVAQRPMGAGERYARLASQYVPGYERIAAATYAGIPGTIDPTLDAPTFGERYNHALNVTRARNDLANEAEDPIGNTAARTVGLTASTAMLGGRNLSTLGQNPTFGQQLKEGARIGAGFGAPIGLANSRSDSWLDKITDMIDATVGGGAWGMALPAVLGGMGLAKRAISPSDASRTDAGRVRQDFEEAGVPPVGPALTDSATINATGRGLTGAVVGGPLRRRVDAATGALQRRIDQELGSGADPGEFGAQSQEFLREQLQEHSTSPEDLDAMNSTQLARVAQGQGESYPTQFGARYRQAEQTPVEGYGTAANIRGNYMDRFLGPRTRGTPDVPWNPDEIDALAENWKFAKQQQTAMPPETLTNFVIRNGGLKDYGREVQYVVGRYKDRPGLVNKNGNTLDDMALKAYEDGFFHGQERPTVNEFIDALREDLHNKSVIRPVDEPRLAAQQSARDMEQELSQLGVWNAKDEAEVRQRLQSTPKEPGTPPPTGPITPTNTYNLINQLGQEARERGQLVGWKDNDFQNPKLWQMLRGHFGDEITDTLKSEYARRQSSQAALRIPGLRDQRTMVRRVLQESENPSPVKPTEVGNVAALRRLHGSMTQDLQTFLDNAGAQRAAEGYRRTDQLYGNWIENMREPLRRVFGRNVAPDEAYRRLLRATQERTQDTRLLQAYYDAVGEKGSPGQTTQATRALLSHALEGGLPGFLETWRGVTPEARQIMFNRDAFVGLAPRLDRLARVAERLQPYAQASERASHGINLGSTHNLALAGTMLWHIPAAIKAAVGAHGLAHLMASPRFVDWLTEIPQRGSFGSGPLIAHLAKAGALGIDDKGLGKSVIDAVRSVIPGAQAASSTPTPEGPQDQSKQNPNDTIFDLAKRAGIPDAKQRILSAPPEERREEWRKTLDAAKGKAETDDEHEAVDYLRKALGLEPRAEPGSGGMMRLGGPKPQAENTSAVKPALFMGPGHRGADEDARQQARKMTEEGTDPAEIWAKTGWMQDKTGAWTDEISDKDAEIKQLPKFKPSDELEKMTTLGAILKHDLLFKARPDLKNLPVKLIDDEATPDGVAASLRNEDTGKYESIEIATQQSKEEFRNSLLHELQHVLEPDSGLDYGSFDKDYNERIGEVRARNTETRSRMGKAERRAKYPPKTEDVPWSLQTTSQPTVSRFNRNLLVSPP